MIHRTAVYVTRSPGGVGGGSREASPYPKSDFLPLVRVQPIQRQEQPPVLT